MSSFSRLFRVGSLAAVLAAAPGIATAAGMAGMSGSSMGGGSMSGVSMGTMGSMGSPGMNGGMNDMMTGMPNTGMLTDPTNQAAFTDSGLRNFSHTGLRGAMPVSKAWRDIPLSDPSAGSVLTPVPAVQSK